MKKWCAVGMVAAWAASAGLGLAQAPAPETKADTKAEKKEMSFMREATMGHMAEVAMGKIAATQAVSQAVKDFGQRMVTDHSKAQDELMAVATKMNIQLPAALGERHQEKINKLAELKGEEFDRGYMKETVKDHEKDVKEYQRAAEKEEDADVKAYAAKTLPVVEDHLKSAKELEATLMGSLKGAAEKMTK